MDEPSSIDERLSQISTTWTMVMRANRSQEGGDATDALERLMNRYHRTVYRYLVGATRNPDTANELFQEFALRFARGGFRNVDPQRGRFRDFLRTVLINLVHDHQRAQHRQLASLDSSVPEAKSPEADGIELDENFIENWRAELLAAAWRQLAELESRDQQPFHTVLLFRAQNPGLPSAEIAVRLTDALNPTSPFTDVGIRKMLQRAREHFSGFLLDEVAVSLETDDLSRLEEELIDLGLLEYCRSAIDRRRTTR